MKKIFLILIIPILLTTLAYAGGSSEGGSKKQYVAIVTGGTGGTYYPVGTIFATLWNQKLGDKGIQSSAQSSGGSIENLSMLQSKEAQLGIAVAALASDAENGLNSFADKQYADVRLVTGLYPELLQFVVTKSSGINTVADIKGKRFSVGAIGSGAEKSSLYVLSTLAGLSPGKDFDDEHLGYAESSAAIQNGQLDGVNIEAGVPTAAVSELAASNTAITLINFSKSEFELLKKENPSYGYFTIPVGTYTGLDEEINTVGFRSVLVTDASVDEELIYTLIKTLYDNFDEIKNSHAVLSSFSRETAAENLPPIKLHPGALRYLEENGVNIPPEMR